MFFVRISIKKNSKQREEESLAWEPARFFLFVLLLFPTFFVIFQLNAFFTSYYPPQSHKFDIFWYLFQTTAWRVLCYISTGRCIKNVNRIQYFIDVSFMKVTPVSRDCGITLVLKVTLSVVVFSFQRCQRTIIKNEGRPPKNEADVNEKHLFVYLFFTWLNNCSKIELSITVKPPLMDSIYYIKDFFNHGKFSSWIHGPAKDWKWYTISTSTIRLRLFFVFSLSLAPRSEY